MSNVVDYYKYWNTEAIVADLDTKRNPFAVLMDHFEKDLNIGGVIRSANAFMAERVYYIGQRKWDRRGAVGTHHYTHFTHVSSPNQIQELQETYTWVAFENDETAEDIRDFVWPERPLIIIGNEANGIHPSLLEISQHKIYVPQFGTVRSLNASTAASIAMYDWVTKNVK